MTRSTPAQMLDWAVSEIKKLSAQGLSDAKIARELGADFTDNRVQKIRHLMEIPSGYLDQRKRQKEVIKQAVEVETEFTTQTEKHQLIAANEDFKAAMRGRVFQSYNIPSQGPRQYPEPRTRPTGNSSLA